MGKRASISRFVAIVLTVGMTSWVMVAEAASRPRMADKVDNVADKVRENAAVAPRFEPTTPAKLDEFEQDPNLKSVHFDFDRARLRPAEARIVKRDARWLRSNTPHEVVVEGYADERGPKTYNARLARRRAMAVKNELVAAGIDPNRVAIVSYGEARPACRKVRSESCWSKNRRADIFVRRASAQAP